MASGRRYNAIDPTLEFISGEYVSILPSDKITHNEVLHRVVTFLINGCRKQNPLFNKLYTGIFYGGSFFDGVKIRMPDEYDIHVKLSFGRKVKGNIFPSYKNGYLHFKMKSIPNKLRVLINADGYLDTNKVMLWMHQTLSTYLGGKKRGKIRTIKTKYIKIQFQRKGPSFVFCVTDYTGITINFDFVPCFEFGGNQWPPYGFRKNPICEKSQFFLIPKPLKDTKKGTIYWRPSFQEQERILIDSKERLKPTLKLIKKLRDNLQHDCIVSFFIKNVFLWEVWRRPDSFWNKPQSYIFMNVLEDYQNCIARGRIDYFWCRKFNLIEHISKRTLRKISWKLKSIIRDIKNNPDDPFLVAEYLLNDEELEDFCRRQ